MPTTGQPPAQHGHAENEMSQQPGGSTPKTSQKDFKCDLCDIGFSTKRALLRHKRENQVHLARAGLSEPDRYGCSQCVQTFARLHDFGRHVKEIHGGRHRAKMISQTSSTSVNISAQDRHEERAERSMIEVRNELSVHLSHPMLQVPLPKDRQVEGSSDAEAEKVPQLPQFIKSFDTIQNSKWTWTDDLEDSMLKFIATMAKTKEVDTSSANHLATLACPYVSNMLTLVETGFSVTAPSFVVFDQTLTILLKIAVELEIISSHYRIRRLRELIFELLDRRYAVPSQHQNLLLALALSCPIRKEVENVQKYLINYWWNAMADIALKSNVEPSRYLGARLFGVVANKNASQTKSLAREYMIIRESRPESALKVAVVCACRNGDKTVAEILLNLCDQCAIHPFVLSNGSRTFSPLSAALEGAHFDFVRWLYATLPASGIKVMENALSDAEWRLFHKFLSVVHGQSSG